MPVRVRLVLETDLSRRHSPRGERRVRLDGIAVDPTPAPWSTLDDPLPRVRVGLTCTWTAVVVGYEPSQPCPGCADSQLRPHEVCLVCHATRQAPRQHPMCRRDERARLLSGPPALRPRVTHARTRRQRRKKIA